MHGTGAPLVLLLDFDGTLVGRLNCAVCEYELLVRAHKGLRAFRDDLVARLRYGIIRPHVEAFLKAARSELEIFIFTASDARWASFVVPCVEAALGVKFNRPLLTRAHCLTAGERVVKSLDRVLPLVHRALVHRGRDHRRG